MPAVDGVETRADVAEDAYVAIGRASLVSRAARERLDTLGGLEPSRALAVEGISHELTDAAIALSDAAGKVRRLYVELKSEQRA